MQSHILWMAKKGEVAKMKMHQMKFLRIDDSSTSLISLNFACLKGKVNLTALERLVARCPNLKSLRLNREVPLDMLQRIFMHAPQLVDLGTGSYVHDPDAETNHSPSAEPAASAPDAAADASEGGTSLPLPSWPQYA